MFDAMSFLLSSLARWLRLRRRKKTITSSAAVSRLPFFSCGGSGDGLSPFVKAKPLRKRKNLNKRIVEHSHQDGRDGVKFDSDPDEPCVWRRTILFGQRCQPLEFNGAIHYDNEGQRLWKARTPPRSPLLSPARSFELGDVDRA